MKLISINNLTTNDKISSTIYGNDARCILSPRTELTNYILDRLKELGISQVWVEDERFNDVLFKEPISFETRAKAISTFKKVRECIEKEKTINIEELKNVAKAMVDDIRVQTVPIGIVNQTYPKEDILVLHAINTAIISTAIGINAEFNFSQLCDLCLAGFIHDIAVSDIKNIEDPSHVQKGFEIFRKYDNISANSTAVIYQHHENWDGSGYPRGIAGSSISEYACIVKIADIFDTSVLGINKKVPAQVVFEEIINNEKDNLCPELVKAFRNSAQIFVNGSQVVLSDGRQALVVKQNKNKPLRPIVRTYSDMLVDYTEEIDLMDNINLKIIQEL